MNKQRRTLVSAAALGIGVLSASFVQAQALSSEQLKSALSNMMQEPVSLLLGLPLDYTDLSVTEADGSTTEFDVVFENANVLGLPLGNLGFDAEVKSTDAVHLSTDLAPLLTRMAPMLGLELKTNALGVGLTVNIEARAIERVVIDVDALFAGLGASDYLSFDRLTLDYDERQEQTLVTIDFGIDNVAFAVDGAEIATLETFGYGAELINIPDWYLHEEVNGAFKQFLMAGAGVITPTDAIANVIDSLVPLFQGDMVDLEGSLDIGQLVLKDLDLLDLDGSAVFDGLTLQSKYDHAGQTERTDINIGGLVLAAEPYWADGAEEFNILEFGGGTITSGAVYAQEYDLNPIADILAATADTVRALDVSALVDPTQALLDLQPQIMAPLLDWLIDMLEASDLEVELGPFAVEIPQSRDESLKLGLGGISLSSTLNINGDRDVQSFTGRLLELSVDLPEDLSVTAGEIAVGYEISDSLAVIQDVLSALNQDSVSLRDGIELAMALYLPDLSLSVQDIFTYGATPTGMGWFEGTLASAEISFSNHDMKTDQARLSQVVGFSGLNVKLEDRFMFDPVLVEVALGKDGPGLLPTDGKLQIDVTDIPMAMILAIADNALLPPMETLLDPDFDPTSLAMMGAALIAPLLASPPSVVIEPSHISGGMVELTASGKVDINPMMPPNYSVGSVTIRVTGIPENQAAIGAILEQIDADGGSDYPDTYETLQQVLGGLAIAGGFGIPADDGALEFVIDVPSGEAANMNGLPIPVPF